MKYQPNFLRLFLIFFIFTAILVSCDGGGDNSSSPSGITGTTNTQTAILKGTIADVVAKEQVSTRSFLIAKLNEMLTFSKNAIAQEEMVDLSGITVQAFDSVNNLVGEGVSDENGNFEFEVPCDTLLTLVFILDGSSIELGGVIAPCPEGEEQGATVFITVNLNFNEDDGESEIEVEEEEDISNAQISCDGDETVFMEVVVPIDGGGGPCIITAGGCHLEIIGANVMLTGCSTCIDTRGNSWVKIETENFLCESDVVGFRSVGNSKVEVTLVGSENGNGVVEELCMNETDDDGDTFIDCDDTDCAEADNCTGEFVENCSDGLDNDVDDFVDCADDDCLENQACAEAECGSLSILAVEDGVDSRGNSSVHIGGEGDDGEESACSEVSIVGMENSIIAVGNAEVIVEGSSCILFPVETVEKGNAEVNVECNGV